jgi:hypothetical protein
MTETLPRMPVASTDPFGSEPIPRSADDLKGVMPGVVGAVFGGGPDEPIDGEAAERLVTARDEGRAVVVATAAAVPILLASSPRVVPDAIVVSAAVNDPLAGIHPSAYRHLGETTLVLAREPRAGALAGYPGPVRIFGEASPVRDDAIDGVVACELVRWLGCERCVTVGVATSAIDGVPDAVGSGSLVAREPELGPFRAIERLVADGAARRNGSREAVATRLAAMVDPRCAGMAGLERALEGARRSRLRPMPAVGLRRAIAEPRVEAVAGGPRVAFVVAIPPDRTLDSEFAGDTVLQHTLERLGRSRSCERIIVLAPEGFPFDTIVDRSRVGLPIEVDRCGATPFPPRREAIMRARLWSDTAWTGGLAGVSAFDEVLAPAATRSALGRRGLDAAVAVGADWPLVPVVGAGGCDELVRFHREDPAARPLCFTAAPPGVGCLLVDRGELARLAGEGRDALLGPRLSLDHPGCLPVDPRVRASLVRLVFDTARAKIRMRRGLEPLLDDRGELSAVDALNAFENQVFNAVPYFAPQHVELELCTGRFGSGVASPHRWGSIQRAPMSMRRAERLLGQLGESGDAVLTLGGAGDPLRHPECAAIVRMAKELGVRGVHLRTELLASPATIEAVVAAGVDVVTVDLHATTAATYRAMVGIDAFATVEANLARLVAARRVLEGRGGNAIGLPWIAPRLQRRPDTLRELPAFVARWDAELGTACLEGPPPSDPTPERRELRAFPLAVPRRVAYRELHRRMLVLSDGGVPISELDLAGDHRLGSVDAAPLLDLWRALVQRRRQTRREEGDGVEVLRLRVP